MDKWSIFLDLDVLRFLAGGVLLTLQVGFIAIVLSTVFATLLAFGRMSRLAPIRYLATGYIEIIRSLPIFLVIMYTYFALARVGLKLPIMWAVITALTIFSSAVIAEIIRAGIQSIEKGQIEAARSLGLSYLQTMRFIVLPRALKRMAPALASQFVALTKASALGAVIGLDEALRRTVLIYSKEFNPIEALAVVASIYFVICFFLSQVSRRMEGEKYVSRADV